MQRTHQWTKSPNPKSEEKVPVSSGRNSRSIPMYLLIFLDHNHLFRSNFTPHHLHLRHYCLLHTHTNSWLFFIQKEVKLNGELGYLLRGELENSPFLWRCGAEERNSAMKRASVCVCDLWRKEKRREFCMKRGNGQLL